MGIKNLHHVNVLTGNLQTMRDFYAQVLDLTDGWRPPFDVDGAWMYRGEVPIVHLVDRPEAGKIDVGRVEHFALAGDNYEAFIALLDKQSVLHSTISIPETSMKSVNLNDPDGNHIEVLFEHAD